MLGLISALAVLVLVGCAAALVWLQRRLDAEVAALRTVVASVDGRPVDLAALDHRSVSGLVSRRGTPNP